MGLKLGRGLCPFGGGRAGSPSNTMWPGPRPTCMPSFVLIRPTVWPQYTNVTDRQDKGPIAYGKPFYKRSPENEPKYFTLTSNCKTRALAHDGQKRLYKHCKHPAIVCVFAWRETMESTAIIMDIFEFCQIIGSGDEAVVKYFQDLHLLCTTDQ